MQTHHLLPIACFCALMTSAPAVASAREDRPKKKPSARIAQLATQLQLSTEQLESVEKLESQRRRSTRTQRKQLRALKAELVQLWRARKPNRAEIVRKHRQISDLRRELQIARVDFRLALFELLSTSQRDRFRTEVLGHNAPAPNTAVRGNPRL